MGQVLNPKYWAVIPAAGMGSRMGLELPKQYLPLAGKAVIEHVLKRFSHHPLIHGVVVALAKDDRYWDRLVLDYATKIWVTTGGEERCHSVLAALRRLQEVGHPEDWVLVHDAARPCLRIEDLDRLINTLSDHPVGGLLALPVRDTMKRSNRDGQVIETVDRNSLWHALTPQMFRLGLLTHAIEQALATGQRVTDEAEAIELAGLLPRLVEGEACNIKITYPEDLVLAEFYLSGRGIKHAHRPRL